MAGDAVIHIWHRGLPKVWLKICCLDGTMPPVLYSLQAVSAPVQMCEEDFFFFGFNRYRIFSP